MATAYSPAPQSSLGGSHWDRAVPVPVQSDDSDQGYGASTKQYRSLKSQENSDYYSNGYNTTRSSSARGSLSSDTGRQRSIGSGVNETSVDDSAWIHRDKLARIESKEMLDAGMRVRRPSSRSVRSRSQSANRSSSRASNKRTRLSDQPNSQSPSDNEMNDGTFYGYDRRNSPAVPPIPQDLDRYSGRGSGLVETSGFGFEDAEDDMHESRKRSASRPGTSRIPVSRNSPAPLSNAVLERDSPSIRSRNGSVALSSSPEMTTSSRKRRSQSLGSQMMLDEAGIPRPKTPRSRPVSMHLTKADIINDSSDSGTSPALSKSPKPAGLNIKKANHNRTASSSTKPRVTSTSSAKDSPSSRPKSSGRPRSTHRPEGEAPWIATMYKPDPMLPPDQQILPTHAKKMMQEQWAREGKSGDVYDRNFNLISANDPTGGKTPLPPSTNKASTDRQSQPGATAQGGTVPPPSAPWNRDSTASASQPTSRAGSVSGGYRITPTISNSSPVLTRDNAPQSTVAHNNGGGGGGVGGISNKRQSMYRLQTVGQLPREADVARETAAEPGARPELPVHAEEKILVHRLDPEKMGLGKRGEEKNKKEGGVCCCVVM